MIGETLPANLQELLPDASDIILKDLLSLHRRCGASDRRMELLFDKACRDSLETHCLKDAKNFNTVPQFKEVSCTPHKLGPPDPPEDFLSSLFSLRDCASIWSESRATLSQSSTQCSNWSTVARAASTGNMLDRSRLSPQLLFEVFCVRKEPACCCHHDLEPMPSIASLKADVCPGPCN